MTREENEMNLHEVLADIDKKLGTLDGKFIDYPNEMSLQECVIRVIGYLGTEIRIAYAFGRQKRIIQYCIWIEELSHIALYDT